MISRAIRFTSTVTYVKSRSTEKHHLAEKLRIFWLQSTVPMGNQTISHVSAGEEMRDMPPHLRWEAMSKYMEESRAKIGEEQTEKRVAYEVSVNKIEFLE